jgi:hypothetical protein
MQVAWASPSDASKRFEGSNLRVMVDALPRPEPTRGHVLSIGTTEATRHRDIMSVFAATFAGPHHRF